MRQQRYPTSPPATFNSSPPFKIAPHRPVIFLLSVMALVTLACAFMESATPSAVSRTTRLPTFTSTPASLSLTTPAPPPATASPFPSQTPTEVPTPTPFSGGWVFYGVQDFFDQNEAGLRVQGEVLNESSASLEVTAITGTFYNELGQIVADGNTTGSWPVSLVAPSGRLPFTLIVPELQEADSFDLRVEAQPSTETPLQDFEVSEIIQSTEENNYCLSGQLRLGESELHSYLVIAAVLFDGQDKVINYADYHEEDLTDLGTDQPREFKICIDPFNQEVARYEIRAWGL